MYNDEKFSKYLECELNYKNFIIERITLTDIDKHEYAVDIYIIDDGLRTIFIKNDEYKKYLRKNKLKKMIK